MTKFLAVCFMVALVVGVGGCKVPTEPAPGMDDGFLTIKDRQFYDAAGRNVILRGVNIGFRHGPRGDRPAPWPHGGAEDFAKIRAWGYNCVRLVIFWSAVEPVCGQYDEAFLKEVDERIGWAKANDLRVIIDMHQDLWGQGVPNGRGAPEWALLDPTRPHAKGTMVWSEAYFTSPLVKSAFDNFWNNTPGPDGVGIQDHFARAWQAVAKRYAEEPAVIGYDLFNEPSLGSPIQSVMLGMTVKMVPRLVARGAKLDLKNEAALAREAMKFARSDMALYREWLSAAAGKVAAMDAKYVAPMYARVAKAIREVDTRHFLLTSPTLTANIGVQNGIPPLPDKDGHPDSLHVFAPHAYDDSTERIDLIFGRLAESAERLKTPLFLGEWGNLTNSDRIFQADPVPAAQAVARLLDAARASDTYWYFKADLDAQPYFKSVLQRPYPMAVAGTLAEYRFDTGSATFTCTWREDPDVSVPTLIYVPEVWYGGGYVCELVPREEGAKFYPISLGTGNGCLVVAPSGHDIDRTLVLRPKS